MTDDKIGQIVADPDFQSLSLGDQQKFLSKVDPDFGQLDTGQFTTFITRYKGSRQSPEQQMISQLPNANAQAKTQAAANVKPVWTPSAGMASLNQQLPRPAGGGEESTLATGAPPAAKTLAELGVGGEAAAAAKGAPLLARLLAGGGGQAAAHVAGNLASGQMPTAGGTVAAGATGILGQGVNEGLQMLPSTRIASAVKGFKDVSEAVGTHTVDVSGPGNAALEARALGEAGGRMPKVLNDFLRRATDPDKGPITYDEARLFYQNATKQSTAELTSMNPIMRSKVAKFTNELGQSLNEVADRAGKAEVLKQATSDYAGAMRTKAAMDKAKSYAVKGAISGATGLPAIYEMLKYLRGGGQKP